MFNLPKKCIVNKFIPKKIFYEKVNIATSVKEEFKNLIEKITWLYKIAPDTLGIDKTKNVEEIEIFELILREKKIPKNVIKAITKGIPYKVLFVIKYKDDIMYSIKVNDQFFTEWNEEINITFNGLNLESIYEDIVRTIIKEEKGIDTFEEMLINKSKKDELLTIINKTKTELKQEKQFNRKTLLNTKLRKLYSELEELSNE